MDNYGTHSHPKVKGWLRRHPRLISHFVPSSSSWLNLVERWFGELTSKRICRGSFVSVEELTKAIEQFLSAGMTTRDHSSGRPRWIRFRRSSRDVDKRWNRYNRAALCRAERNRKQCPVSVKFITLASVPELCPPNSWLSPSSPQLSRPPLRFK